MKLRASKSEIRNNSYYVLSLGYCEADYLLKSQSPFAYSCGIYGWSCDYYEINTGKHSIIISTGYSPINDKNIKLDKDFYKITRKYNEKARSINAMPNKWETTQKKLQKLLYKYIDKEIFHDNNK